MKSRNRKFRLLVLLLGISIALTALWSCQHRSTAKLSAPVLDNLGDHQVDISTESPLAQKLFNQGITLAYAFNHREAARSFREAATQDPECAMCHWGLALVMGPNINAPMDPTNLGEIYTATQEALRLAPKATDWEKALIEALAFRYPDSTTVDRAPLDQDYADAMREVYRKYSDHQDVAVLFAESLMDLHPWDLYEQDGSPKEWTPEIVDLLGDILNRWPKNPGANHLYIHAVEASTSPERGLPSADRLRSLVPGAGHLVHMPSHIYIRTGRYHEGSVANQKAMVADSLYISSCNAQGIYPLLYYPHNIHFLAATAALEGRGDISINAAFQLSGKVDKEMMKEPDWTTLQHYFSIPYYVLVKFAEWDRILEMPLEDEAYPKAVLHYARGMAYANQKQLEKARHELNQIHKIQAEGVLDGMMIWDLNTMTDLVDITRLVLTAEIDAKSGRYDQAISALRQAIAIEDQLTYTEPPDWFFSVRHELGNVLLQAGRFSEAETVYLEDLKNLPENGWALNGLYLSLLNQQRNLAAQKVKSRFDKAWKWANISLEGSEISEIAYNSYQDLDLFNQTLALAHMDRIPLCVKPSN